jgi:cell division protein YceG involved in septum cleavage
LARDRRSDTSEERTEEERERAREERERRRMAKAGATQPAPAPTPLPPPLTESPVEEETPPNGSVARDPQAFEPVLDQTEVLEDAPAEPVSDHAGVLEDAHLHRPHISPVRKGAARIGALLALVVVLAALAGAAVLLVRHAQRRKPPPAPAFVKVVIPEGYTRVQIAALAHADGLRGSYLTASKSSTALRPSEYGVPTQPPTHPAAAGTSNLEGFLFPATYEMYAGAPASRLVSEQLAAFRENFGGAEVHRAKVLGITPYQLLIVASIIEREAAIARDRPLVAAVIYNRLRLHMTLGVDSTLRYALHDFTHPLTEVELAGNSPYNTRTHQGLPPTPISNPGAAAIKAAARPAAVSYLYYVAGADGCGEQMFSTSYAQFEKNAGAYREALSKNGGRVPTCKKR